MFIIRFHGGLGNQMFQYAFYQYVENYITKDLKADLTWFDRNKKEHQGYELEKVFGIRMPVASYEEVARVHEYYPRYYPLAGLRYLARKNAARKNRGRDTMASHIFDFGEKQYVFNNIYESLDLSKDWYIEGVFCSDAYLRKCERKVKSSFNFITKLEGMNLSASEAMKDCESVAIHVRRGDYVGNVFDILDLSYYQNAVEEMKKRVKKPVFYIFSDDMDYVREKFTFIEDGIPVHNVGQASYMDMKLISCCKHAIIANSTFSYWGALLGETPASIIIAPKRYKADEQVALARGNWIKM